MSAATRREAVHYATTRGVSKRRAGALLNISGSSLRYKPHRAGQEKDMVAKIKELSQAHPRFGYRRITALLRHEGQTVNSKRIYRLWKREGMAIKRKPAYRRRHAGQHRWMSAVAPNGIWAYDFVFDACANGQKLKCLTLVDEYTRESLCIDVGAHIRSSRVIEALERLVTLHGAPAFLCAATTDPNSWPRPCWAG